MRTLAWLLALALVAASCSAPPAEPTELLAEAPDRLVESGTARLSLRVGTFGERVPGGGYTVQGQGARDFAGDTSRLDLDLGPQGGAVELISEGEELFVRGALFTELGADPDQWVRLELEALSEQIGLDLPALGQSQAGTGSTAYVELLRGAVDVTELDEGEVGGVAVRRFELEANLRRAANLAPAETRAEVTSLVDTAGLPETLPMQAWIDADGLPRRVAALVELERPDGASTDGETETGGGIRQETVLDLDDFGEPVDIAPPEQAISLAELIGELGDDG